MTETDLPDLPLADRERLQELVNRRISSVRVHDYVRTQFADEAVKAVPRLLAMVARFEKATAERPICGACHADNIRTELKGTDDVCGRHFTKAIKTIQELEDELSALAAERERMTWQPIDTAPKTGPVKDVLLRYLDYKMRPCVAAGHWAHGDGDGLMPPFGPAWFVSDHSDGFRELTFTVTHWAPFPTPAGEDTSR